MKIKSLQLKNFKRFTDLTLQDIPENAKLVLLIGSNGSGKSSVFDAFEYLASQSGKYGLSKDYTYYNKTTDERLSLKLETHAGDVSGIIDNTWKTSPKITLNSFYGRTSFRQIPRLTRKSLGTKFNIESDTDRPPTFIDKDERFENDLEHIFGKLLKEYFVSKDKSEIIVQVIEPINDSLERIFGSENGTKLKLMEIIPPLEGKTAEITFLKGNSQFHYHNLSAGEKEVFNILINLVARKEYFQDTVYFFDEIDLHLNTKLQFKFLKEIVENWIPEKCQFWTASHSLGFIQYANKSESAIIIDFDDYDFDFPKVLSPEPKDTTDVYEIAVGKDILPDLFKDYKKVFVENTDGDNYYSNVKIENFLFIKRKDKKAIFDNIISGDTHGLIDRDFLSNEDVDILETAYPNLLILRLYSIENYIYHPDNLFEYCSKRKIDFNKDKYTNEVYAEKEKIKHELFAKISDSRQTYPFGKEINPADKNIAVRFSKSQQNQDQIAVINKEIDSSDFDSYYKHIPMKNYLTQLTIRQSISKIELSKTGWFKNQIESILKKL